MHRTVAVSVCLALVGMVLHASVQNVQQATPAQVEQFVTLSEAKCPPVVTLPGVEGTIKFKADRSLLGFRMILALTVPVEPAKPGVSYTNTTLYYKGEKPSIPTALTVGHYTMSSDDEGILTLLLAPPPADPLKATSGVLLKGKRTISIVLKMCLDQSCGQNVDISNVVKVEVDFQ